MLCKAIIITVWRDSADSAFPDEISSNSSYIKINAFIAWCSASSCFPNWLRMAQILRWISQGFDIIKEAETSYSVLLRQVYSRASAISRYCNAFLNLLVFRKRHAKLLYVIARIRSFPSVKSSAFLSSSWHSLKSSFCRWAMLRTLQTIAISLYTLDSWSEAYSPYSYLINYWVSSNFFKASIWLPAFFNSQPWSKSTLI